MLPFLFPFESQRLIDFLIDIVYCIILGRI